jgi:hypothetical protein
VEYSFYTSFQNDRRADAINVGKRMDTQPPIAGTTAVPLTITASLIPIRRTDITRPLIALRPACTARCLIALRRAGLASSTLGLTGIACLTGSALSPTRITGRLIALGLKSLTSDTSVTRITISAASVTSGPSLGWLRLTPAACLV